MWGSGAGGRGRGVGGATSSLAGFFFYLGVDERGGGLILASIS